jgi:glycosyltransferase involved in cell wall biosynthesis
VPPSVLSAPRPKLLFLITEDWFFYGARLALARAARDAGFDVVVATRVRDHGDRIRNEGFALRPLGWRRGGDGLLGAARVIAEIVGVYRAERPDILHHAALKPIVFGAIAAHVAFRRGSAPARVAAVMGLGGVFSRIAAGRTPWLRPFAIAVRLAMRGGQVTVENPDDATTLARFGVDPARIVLIRGVGVDTARFVPLPEAQGPSVTVALVGRMLRSKGVLDAVAAIRELRAAGVAVELVLAGAPDPDSGDSLSEEALSGLSSEPGVEWHGHVADVREVWRRAAIAVLPSTYGEGLPAALLEAAACGRPIVGADMPGIREIVRQDETGLLVPPGDVSRLAEALAALAADPMRRQAMGQAGRALVEREFSEAIVAGQTLQLYRGLLRHTGRGQ